MDKTIDIQDSLIRIVKNDKVERKEFFVDTEK